MRWEGRKATGREEEKEREKLTPEEETEVIQEK